MINPIFELGARLAEGNVEDLEGETLLLPTVTSNKMPVPHVLKDGADSVGVPGATLRVYINIGMFSQHWLECHNALIGLTPQKPFSIALAQSNSVYWLATQTKFMNVAKFFMRLKSFRLEDAPGGGDHITKDEAVMTRGKVVFAENCAACHSSKRRPAGADEDEWFRQEVLKPDFRDGNFFSDDHRYPITKIKSNAARACATNAKRGHVWNNFSSETYKNLPSVGDIDGLEPVHGRDEPMDGARRRTGLLSHRVADQRLGHGAAAAQQHAGQVHRRSLNRRTPGRIRRRDSKTALAGKAAWHQFHLAHLARMQFANSDPPSSPTASRGPQTLCRSRRLFPGRADSRRHADQPAGEH